MMKALLLFAWMVGAAHAAKIPCKIKMPMIQDGCQGDGCSFFSHLILDHDVDLLKDVQTKALVQKILKGTKIKKPFSFAIEVKRPGIYKVIDKTIEFEYPKYTLKRGTVFEVLYYADKGKYGVCIEDKIAELVLDQYAEMLEPAKTEDWIKVRLDTKTSGALKRSDVKVISSE